MNDIFSVPFFLNAIALGVGLAMDAFSVSLANGLYYPHMTNQRRLLIAGTFGIFQTVMPLLGWLFVRTLLRYFELIQNAIPWIGIILLSYIGIKMLIDGIRNAESVKEKPLDFKTLFIQGVATSIDALSVGFTNSSVNFLSASIESMIIGLVTFFICLFGLFLGNKVGSHFQNKAVILGGCVLLFIAVKMLIEIV